MDFSIWNAIFNQLKSYWSNFEQQLGGFCYEIWQPWAQQIAGSERTTFQQSAITPICAERRSEV